MGSRWNLQVALVGLIVSLATLRGITTGDEAIHYAHARSLLLGEGGVLELDPGRLPVPSRARAGGLFYQSAEGLRSAHAPGLAWLGLPLVWVGERAVSGPAPPLDALFVGGEPEAVLAPIRADPRLALFSLIGPLSFALALLALLATAREIGLGRPARWAIFFALLASPLGVYGGATFAQAPLAACVAFALWAGACVDSKPSPGAHLLLGLVAAAGLVLRPESGPLWLAALLGAALANRRALAQKLSSGAAVSRAGASFHRGWALVWLAPFAAIVALASVGLPATLDGFAWAHLVEGAPGLLVSPAAGLFVHAPFTIIALAWGTRHARGWLSGSVAAGLVGAIALYGAWFDWPSDLCFGPRLLAPAMPGLALLFGVAWQGGGRGLKVSGTLAILAGLALSLPARLIAWPRVPSRPSWDWRALTDGFASLGDAGASDLLLFAGPVVPVAVALTAGLGLATGLAGRRART